MLIPADTLHIWQSKASAFETDKLRYYLSPNEVARSNRFHRKSDCENFIVSRGVLRAILGQYLNRSPEKIEFAYGPNGKPMLGGELAGQLQFNLSHSQGITLYVFGMHHPVGIDLEFMGSVTTDLSQIANRFFSRAELEQLESAEKSNYSTLFFTYWTRKEAHLKALGLGIAEGLSQFDTAMIPHTQSKVVEFCSPLENVSEWSLMDFSPEAGFAAALVTQGAIQQVEMIQDVLL